MAFNEFDYDPTKHTLGAINTMLNAINEVDLDSETDIDNILEAKMARKILMEVKREVLSSGWNYNEDMAYTLPLGNLSTIPIPANVLVLSSNANDLTIRNHYLYSITDQSIRFTEAQEVNIRWDLSFNDIPQTLRQYITMKASRKFRDRTIGEDTEQHGFTLEDERDAYLEARRAELFIMDNNMIANMNTTGLRL